MKQDGVTFYVLAVARVIERFHCIIFLLYAFIIIKGGGSNEEGEE